MKARRKGTNSPFVEIDRVQLEGSDVLYSTEVIEFQAEYNFDYLSTELKINDHIAEEKHWQDVKERAAIAAMQGILANPNRQYQSSEALAFADALVEQLKKAL